MKGAQCSGSLETLLGAGGLMRFFILISGAAEGIVGVHLGDDLFAEDHFASGLDLCFISQVVLARILARVA